MPVVQRVGEGRAVRSCQCYYGIVALIVGQGVRWVSDCCHQKIDILLDTACLPEITFRI